MNWEHLKAFLWLRWRLLSNRNKRASTGSRILQTIFIVLTVVGGVVAFITGLLVGFLVLYRLSAENFMLVWDGIVIGFIFIWMTELMIELQRSELLSLDKFLHLPVSLSSAFLINYIGSISGVGALFFLPLMLGLAIGLVFSKGLMMLLLFPLIGAFALMVTALTHQFRGWLASLMVNQRRRRTIITMATLVFILIVQIPNIINISTGRFSTRSRGETRRQIQQLDREMAQGSITREEHDQQVRELRGGNGEEEWKQVQGVALVVNRVVPLGWLPYGAAASLDGRATPALLAIAGLGLIAAISLRRSYQTTLRLYTGQFTSKNSRKTSAKPILQPAGSTPSKYAAAFLEKKIAPLSEQASAVTVASIRSLTRAPEAKLMLLSPLIMVFVFGGMFISGRSSGPPELVRPLMPSGAFTFLFFTMIGIVGNQFSFDRSGFRSYVLSPVPRRDILLGKNLSMAPFVLGFMVLIAALFQIVYPMRIDHFLAVLVQTLPMYLVFCLAGNLLSILAPMPIAAGSLKPVKPKATTVLIHLGFIFLFPVVLTPILIPLGLEFLLSWSGVLSWLPAYLAFAIAEAALVVWLYPLLLAKEGAFLQQREQKILEIVTSKAE